MLCISTYGLLVGTTMNSMLLISNIDGYTPLQDARIEDTCITQVNTFENISLMRVCVRVFVRGKMVENNSYTACTVCI